jgi:hypothetical protein
MLRVRGPGSDRRGGGRRCRRVLARGRGDQPPALPARGPDHGRPAGGRGRRAGRVRARLRRPSRRALRPPFVRRHMALPDPPSTPCARRRRARGGQRSRSSSRPTRRSSRPPAASSTRRCSPCAPGCSTISGRSCGPTSSPTSSDSSARSRPGPGARGRERLEPALLRQTGETSGSGRAARRETRLRRDRRAARFSEQSSRDGAVGSV